MTSHRWIAKVCALASLLASTGALANQLQLQVAPSTRLQNLNPGMNEVSLSFRYAMGVGKGSRSALLTIDTPRQLAYWAWVSGLVCETESSLVSDRTRCEGADRDEPSIRYSILFEESGSRKQVEGFQVRRVLDGASARAELLATFGEASRWVPLTGPEIDQYCKRAGSKQAATRAFSMGHQGELIVNVGITDEVAHYCVRGGAYLPAFEEGKAAARENSQ